MHRRDFELALTSIALSVCLMGCAEKSSDPRVTGQVSLQGSPLTDATLMFYPPNGRATPVPLEKDGTYSIVLPPGNYRVAVMQGANMPEDYEEGDPIPPPENPVPKKYSRRQGSPLEATVAPDQSEPIDFALE